MLSATSRRRTAAAEHDESKRTHTVKEFVTGNQPSGPYSPGIKACGQFLFVAGQTGRRGMTMVEGGIVAETRQALENLGTVLHAAGADFSDVVRCGVFLADLDDWAAMNEVYAEFFPEPRPARTTIGALLGRAKVEIDAVAVIHEPESESG
jgi:2-iminobutanoate/2-iminopropanoate deaminase